MSNHKFSWPLALIVLAHILTLDQQVLIARCHATTTYAANSNSNNNNGFEHTGATDGRKEISNDENLTISVDQVGSMQQQQQQQHNNADQQQHGNDEMHSDNHQPMADSINDDSNLHQNHQVTGDQTLVASPYEFAKSDLIEATNNFGLSSNNGHPTTETAINTGHSPVQDHHDQQQQPHQQPQQNRSRNNTYRGPVLSSLGGAIPGSEPPDDDPPPSRPRQQEPYQINTESPTGGPVVIKQPQQQQSHESNMRMQVTPASRQQQQQSKPIFNSTDMAQAVQQQHQQQQKTVNTMNQYAQQVVNQPQQQPQQPPTPMSSFAQNSNNNNRQQFHQQQQQPQQQHHQPQQQMQTLGQVMAPVAAPIYNPVPPLYLGHNPFIDILKPHSYADDNIMTLNLSHSHIYEIDSDAFVGQRFEHIDLSNNKLGLIHARSFRIGPIHSRHNPYDPHANHSKAMQANGPAGAYGPTRRPPPTNPKSVTIDFSHNPFIVALSGAFDHIDVPNCLLNFTNSKVELKFGAFKKYFKEHPGHIIDVESVDCCEQEWLLGYKHNFVQRTHCEHDPNLYLSKVSQQVILESCAAYVKHNMNIQYGPCMIHQSAVASGHPRNHNHQHIDNNYLTYVILGGTAMVLASLSIYILVYMCSLKAALVYRMQPKS